MTAFTVSVATHGIYLGLCGSKKVMTISMIIIGMMMIARNSMVAINSGDIVFILD